MGVVEHLAALVGGQARIIYSARTLTATTDASQVGSTFVVNATLYGAWSTRHLSELVHNKSMFTYANWSVATHFTAFALITWGAAELTRILTGSCNSVTCVIDRAI